VSISNFSFYPVGNNVVIIAFDSKSISSYSLNPFNKGGGRNIPRSQGISTPQGTTHQTYIWWTKKTIYLNEKNIFLITLFLLFSCSTQRDNILGEYKYRELKQLTH